MTQTTDNRRHDVVACRIIIVNCTGKQDSQAKDETMQQVARTRDTTHTQLNSCSQERRQAVTAETPCTCRHVSVQQMARAPAIKVACQKVCEWLPRRLVNEAKNQRVQGRGQKWTSSCEVEAKPWPIHGTEAARGQNANTGRLYTLKLCT